ncbi:MAG: hypothetical protein GY869_31490, partial [Planctomycetes bacterium]|nr:hypothetical protein [Planctomycetota bacterium]
NGERKITVEFLYDGSPRDPKYKFRNPNGTPGTYYWIYKQRYQNASGEGSMTLMDFKNHCDTDVRAGAFVGENSNHLFIKIYNGVKDFQRKNIQAEDKNGCKYWGIIDRLSWESTLESQYSDWTPAPDITYSIAGGMFHELLHIALYDAGFKRYRDEATVQDAILQIFPRGIGP